MRSLHLLQVEGGGEEEEESIIVLHGCRKGKVPRTAALLQRRLEACSRLQIKELRSLHLLLLEGEGEGEESITDLLG